MTTAETNYRREVRALARGIFIAARPLHISQKKRFEVALDALAAAEDYLGAEGGWEAARDEEEESARARRAR